LFRDIYEVVKEYLLKVITSRLFAISIFFTILFGILVVRLFDLQIVNGERYLTEYRLKTERQMQIDSTRGNIRDRNGELLAYSELTYSIVISDTGEYVNKTNQLNNMLIKLVRILNEYDVNLVLDFRIDLAEDGNFFFTTTGETSHRAFLRDVYGVKLEDLDRVDSNGNIRNSTSVTANELMEYLVERFRFDEKRFLELDTKEEVPVVYNNKELLQMIKIRYSLVAVSYQTDKDVMIASNINDETVAVISENSAVLRGVRVTEDFVRKYNASYAFAPIIGYTGRMSEDEFEKLIEIDDTYTRNDIVGITGLEKVLEQNLRGKKGINNVITDSSGRVLEVVDSTDPVTGDDIYLTIRQDLQVAVYHIIEQKLAGILYERIKNKDIVIPERVNSATLEIPIKTAYFQLINNNILDIRLFAQDNASDIEKQIYAKFIAKKENINAGIFDQLNSLSPMPYNELSNEMKEYMNNIYSTLANDSKVILTNMIANGDEMAMKWTNGTVSFREYLYYGIANGWIDTSKLPVDNRYLDADELYSTLIEYIMLDIDNNISFNKLIYKYLIEQNFLSGRELCLALFEQDVLVHDETAIRLLTENADLYAYQFFMDKIKNIEITPAQLALDPYSGFCVITDPNNGEVLAEVSYPGYDNNKLSGRVDTVYYNKLINDLSHPFYNSATRVRTAPGSTFKPLAAIIGLEEGVITASELITDTGIFDKVQQQSVRCAVFPGNHGAINVLDAMQDSCNYFFNEIGYRLSLDITETYIPSQGIAKMQEYTTLFALDKKSGVEIDEIEPNVSNMDPIRSMMGQGTHSYTATQLARFISTIANKGTVYDLTILDKRTNVNGELQENYSSEALSKLDISNSTWAAVHQGMVQVVSNGSARRIFADIEVAVAGKTGTAQENQARADHGLFVSYAPADNPEIAVTVQLPYGYGSTNAVEITKEVYKYYYGQTDYETIINGNATGTSGVHIVD